MNPATVPEADALDAWLATREAEPGDVRPDADARIVWAGDAGRRTPVSIVYLHGFSASRMETAPLCDRLAARLGANLFYARLTGHGRTPAAMGEARMQDWIDDADEALEVGRRIGERVVLIGTSTGGTLATLLAARPAPDLAAMVLIAPNFGPKDARAGLLTWPGARLWVPWVVGAQRVVPPENEAHGRFWTTTYPSTSLIPMMQLVRRVARTPLDQVRTPVLALWSADDEVVDSRRTGPTLERMRNAHVEVEVSTPVDDPAVPNPSRHVIVGEAFAPRATDAAVARIGAFLEARIPEFAGS